MNNRQKDLLNHIVEDYIKTAQPVGSDYLVDKLKLDVSAATVRNDCRELEEEGFLSHPHTSAGRMPTEEGYREYLDLRFKNKDLRKSHSLIDKESRALEKINNQLMLGDYDDRSRIKGLAKALAELSRGAVLIGFDKRDVYYTGLSYLFSQPEFQNLDLVCGIGEVVDSLDEVFPRIYEDFGEKVMIKIGQENLFSAECSFIGTKIRQGASEQLLGVLGPMRMDYLGNIDRLEYVKGLLAG